MRSFSKVIVIVLLYSLFVLSAFSQKTSNTPSDKIARFSILVEELSKFDHQSQYEEMIKVGKEALKIGEEIQEILGTDDPTIAGILNPTIAGILDILVLAHMLQGQHIEAEPLCYRSLAIKEKVLGPDHVDVSLPLNNLAEIYTSQGKYAEAESLLKRALAIMEKALGPDNVKVASSLNDLAVVYESQGKYAEAESLLKRALAIGEKALGPDNVEVASSLNGLAVVYKSQGKYAEAESLLKRALAIREKIFGPDDRSVAKVLNNLAILYTDQGKYTEAELLHKRALAIREKTLGSNHPEMADTLQDLSHLYYYQGRYTEVEPFLKRALIIKEKALGPDHPDVAGILNDQAVLYNYQGKYTEAESIHNRALAIREKTLGADHPYVAQSLSNLAALYEAQGRDAEAESFLNRALLIKEKALGPDHPDITTEANNLAAIYKNQGKYAESETILKRVLAIREKAFGPYHPDVAVTLSNIAVLNILLGRVEMALSLMQRALLIDEHTIDNVFSLASEREKFAFLHTLIHRFEGLQSLVTQELNTNSDAIRIALDTALRRKGLVLDALARERMTLLTSDNPDNPKAAEIAKQLQIILSRIAALTLSGPGNLPLEVYKNLLTNLESDKEKLEEELSHLSDIHTTRKREQLQQVSSEYVAKALESNSVLVEYVFFRRYDFKAKRGMSGKSYRYLAYVLPAGEKSNPTLIDLGEADVIDKAVKAFRQDVANAPELISKLGEKEAERQLIEKGNRIYQLTFSPLKPAIGKSNLIYLAPDGDLNLIPFEVLSDENRRYLIENYQFNYLSSGRDLLRFDLNKTDDKGKEIVMLAAPDYDVSLSDQNRSNNESASQIEIATGKSRSIDLKQLNWLPLPGTRKEVEAIKAIMKQSGEEIKLYMSKEARERIVKEIKSPQILHLATHGFFLDEQDKSKWYEDNALSEAEEQRGMKLVGLSSKPTPVSSTSSISFMPSIEIENPLLRSGLVLAGANRLGKENNLLGNLDDGILTALEVSGISLWGTELVVLSACETGVGESRKGEGVFGLRRAFQLAGARTIVMSLWSIPDEETMTLMIDFYRNMKAGIGKSQALKEASLDLMRSRRKQNGVAHPLYWGAFVCVGNP